MSARRHVTPPSKDEGICLYAGCRHDIPDGITIQLCQKHLRTAYAAFIIANPDVAHEANVV